MHSDRRRNERSGPGRWLEAHAQGCQATFPAVGVFAGRSGVGGMGAKAWPSGRRLDRRSPGRVEDETTRESFRGAKGCKRVRQKTMAGLVAGTGEPLPPCCFG